MPPCLFLLWCCCCSVKNSLSSLYHLHCDYYWWYLVWLMVGHDLLYAWLVLVVCLEFVVLCVFGWFWRFFLRQFCAWGLVWLVDVRILTAHMPFPFSLSSLISLSLLSLPLLPFLLNHLYPHHILPHLPHISSPTTHCVFHSLPTPVLSSLSCLCLSVCLMYVFSCPFLAFPLLHTHTPPDSLWAWAATCFHYFRLFTPQDLLFILRYPHHINWRTFGLPIFISLAAWETVTTHIPEMGPGNLPRRYGMAAQWAPTCLWAWEDYSGPAHSVHTCHTLHCWTIMHGHGNRTSTLSLYCSAWEAKVCEPISPAHVVALDSFWFWRRRCAVDMWEAHLLYHCHTVLVTTLMMTSGKFYLVLFMHVATRTPFSVCVNIHQDSLLEIPATFFSYTSRHLLSKLPLSHGIPSWFLF